ncbi:YybH family protein [Massilia glaciei]|uniref:Nuclear transport factor 2 family protein n=1 Tax=Massilia glaciei TaxID=1524097 RepID=A0A2U2HMS5_9BURK|nr:nuclear transport factor 2 family protein [Massilia glaciei]PWF48818.1 nuclear transport factor 2 family protein [Massilia glaciei]
MRKMMFVMMMAFAAPAFAATPQETVNGFHAAMSAGDKVKLASFLSPDVLIYESGFVERSRAEYASHHLGADVAFAKAVTRKVLKHGARVAGNQAVLWEETETTGTLKGKPVHVFGTETTVLEKVGADWLIVHVHWSSRKAK